ncbi:MAG: sigma-70 family RNA polymerase sigma factor [Deltaproteobacteria bacterium]|nr:sigma-70 family RNA polymerase sigma factor [Deltaproteobacteria bacterium]
MTHGWTEDELIERLRKGQEEAYRVLVREYHSRLYSLACGITLDREESQDILQEVFLKVCSNIKGFRGKSSLFTWLRRITVNESLNWRRRAKRRFRWKHQPLEAGEIEGGLDLESEDAGPEVMYQKKELEKSLNNGLNSLPEEARTIFILRELEGLSYEEIAAQLNLRKGTVSSRLFYTRQRLKEFLERGQGRS